MAQTVRQLIIGFLGKRDPRFTDAGLADDVNLVKSRIINSIGLVDLLLFLEVETGRQIDFTTIDPDRMMTIAGIQALFGVRETADG